MTMCDIRRSLTINLDECSFSHSYKEEPSSSSSSSLSSSPSLFLEEQSHSLFLPLTPISSCQKDITSLPESNTYIDFDFGLNLGLGVDHFTDVSKINIWTEDTQTFHIGNEPYTSTCSTFEDSPHSYTSNQDSVTYPSLPVSPLNYFSSSASTTSLVESFHRSYYIKHSQPYPPHIRFTQLRKFKLKKQNRHKVQPMVYITRKEAAKGRTRDDRGRFIKH